ncbi:MAG: Flp pilus assembly protein CpaB [Coriobacteriia bacterium]|nr:Flp pilus assembly protein CpaB [Coriobacteriia bacterium]
MKKKRTLVLSVICGILCAGCVFLYTYGVKTDADQARAEVLERYGGEQMEACVATRDIAPGETIDERAVERKLWIADLLPEGAVTKVEDAVGQKASSSILAGEVVSTKRFGQESALLDVPQGLVAVSVPAKEVQAIGGAVMPGMRVHLYATGNTSTSRVGTDVLVLATSRSVLSSDQGSSSGAVTWVTVAVEPEDVRELVSVANKEQLYFALPGNDGSAEQAMAQSEDKKNRTKTSAGSSGAGQGASLDGGDADKEATRR